MGALGCVLLDESSAKRLLDQLSIEDFNDLRHQTVFTALQCLALEGKPLNIVTLGQWLLSKNRIEEADGLVYVARLPDQTPSVANFESFRESLIDCRTRRAILRDAGELSRLAGNLAISPATLVDAAHRMADNYGRNGTSHALLQARRFNPDLE